VEDHHQDVEDRHQDVEDHHQDAIWTDQVAHGDEMTIEVHHEMTDPEIALHHNGMHLHLQNNQLMRMVGLPQSIDENVKSRFYANNPTNLGSNKIIHSFIYKIVYLLMV
jgi:hypothetical protein